MKSNLQKNRKTKERINSQCKFCMIGKQQKYDSNNHDNERLVFRKF